jgi:hypothetical protein
MPRKKYDAKGGLWPFNQKTTKTYKGLSYTLETINTDDNQSWMIEEVDGVNYVKLLKIVPKTVIKSIRDYGIKIDSAKNAEAMGYKPSHNKVETGKQYFCSTYYCTIVYEEKFPDPVLIVVEAPVEIASTWDIVFKGGSELYVQRDIPPKYIYISQDSKHHTDCDKFIEIFYYNHMLKTMDYTELCLDHISKVPTSSQSTLQHPPIDISPYISVLQRAISRVMVNLDTSLNDTQKTALNKYLKVEDFREFSLEDNPQNIIKFIEVTNVDNLFNRDEKQAYFRLVKYSKLQKGSGVRVTYKKHSYKIRQDGRGRYILTKMDGRVSLTNVKKWQVKNTT